MGSFMISLNELSLSVYGKVLEAASFLHSRARSTSIFFSPGKELDRNFRHDMRYSEFLHFFQQFKNVNLFSVPR